MSETARVYDKASWVPGPWQTEQDKLNWTTKAGLPGMIVRNYMGILCGYVAVTKEHPLYGSGYDNVDVSVHGGLTYANKCTGAICHTPEPGESDDVWWFGFDCGHGGDLTPRHLGEFLRNGDVYRTIAYVQDEVENLAAQLCLTHG